MHRSVRVAALGVLVGWICLSCDPGYGERVINHADHEFVLRYEDKLPGAPIFEFTIPPASSGFTLGGIGSPGFRGFVVIMTLDCRPLGRLEIDADDTLLILEADDSYSFPRGFGNRTDIDLNTKFPETDRCPA